VEFVECHLVLKKRPAEFRFIVHIGDFGNRIGMRSNLCVELLRNRIGAVLELLKEPRRDSEEVNTRECLDLADLERIRQTEVSEWELEGRLQAWIETDVTEGCTHNDGVIAVLFVVIEDALDRLDTWILIAFVVLPRRFLVPVKDLAWVAWSACLHHMTEGEERDDALGRQMARSRSHRLRHTRQPGRSQREG
jgi:hypothetical protein